MLDLLCLAVDGSAKRIPVDERSLGDLLPVRQDDSVLFV